MVQWGREGRWRGEGCAHIRRTSFERLHGPAEHLELALSECGSRASGSSSAVVRHVDSDVACVGEVGCWYVMWCECKSCVMIVG
jgi:hypothetical protein